MRVSIWFSYLISLVLLLLLPFVFARVMQTSLEKLHVSPGVATVLIIAIFLGGAINIPVARIRQLEKVPANPMALWGLDEMFPRMALEQRETLIAVNVGGCLIPLGLVAYELSYLSALGPPMLLRIVIACAINTVVCYLLARPIKGLGIGMPGFVPPLVATSAALLLAPDVAPPVAFIAGVMGPLIGADLLHLKDVTRIATTGVGSIGGAGTFDGIVLSGIIAAYLA